MVGNSYGGVKGVEEGGEVWWTGKKVRTVNDTKM